MFNLSGKLIYAFLYLRVVASHKDCSLPMGNAFALGSLLQYFQDTGAVAAFAGSFFNAFQYFVVIYEIIGMDR